MIVIEIKKSAGVFAENKDIAGILRDKTILPTLRSNKEVVLDFKGVEGVTQSFVHAMISEAMREFGAEVLDHIIFRDCNRSVQAIIEIVVDYMQASE